MFCAVFVVCLYQTHHYKKHRAPHNFLRLHLANLRFFCGLCTSRFYYEIYIFLN